MDTRYAIHQPDHLPILDTSAGPLGLTAGDGNVAAEPSVVEAAKGSSILMIIIRPGRHGRYRMFLDGQPLGKRGCRTPFFTAARKLLDLSRFQRGGQRMLAMIP